jgi:hypothetical protein
VKEEQQLLEGGFSLASRVVVEHQLESHFPPLMGQLGRELGEVSANMRRWARQLQERQQAEAAGAVGAAAGAAGAATAVAGAAAAAGVAGATAEAAKGTAGGFKLQQVHLIKRRQLVQLIKDHDRVGVNGLLMEAAKQGVPLALCALHPEDGSTALHYSAQVGAAEICQDLLLFWGASLHRVNKRGMSSLDYATNDAATTCVLRDVMCLLNDY